MTAYVDTLNDAWHQHTIPKRDDAPTVVSTFAGCGGSTLGYSMAGFRELLAVEWDPHAAALLRRNFPDVPLFHGDIADLDTNTLGLEPGELDVLDGSPPCQGFSTIGKRHIDDPRNQLFREYVRLVDELHPKVLVMENVSGMVKGPMKRLFADILHALRAAGPGYRVTARLVDASYLGVPQTRQRMIFIGVRDDLPAAPTHPQPSTHRITVRDAWRDLPDGSRPAITDPKVRTLVPHIPPGGKGSDVLKAAGKKPSYFATHRLAWHRPAPTIVKQMRPNGSGATLHPDRDDMVTIAELARLQSFPDQYDWRVTDDEHPGHTRTYVNQRARIGNSVPPLMMRAIATTVAEHVLATADRKETAR